MPGPGSNSSSADWSASKLADEKKLSKRQLEIRLAKLKILEKPSLRLEQYPVSPRTASELLYMAGFEHSDLQGRIIDLGTGTGRLAIGASLMGSDRVVGVDLDPKALEIARENSRTAGVNVEWIQSPIDRIDGTYGTVIMNPPYGSRTAHADIAFLEKAFKLAPVTYTIHKSSTRNFLTAYVKRSERKIDQIRNMTMELPRLFTFHTRKSKDVEVDLYRIVS